MSEETPADLQQLVHAIKQNTTWSGQTTRELRDRVEEGSKQLGRLAQALEDSSHSLEAQVARLAAAVEEGSGRADRLRKAVTILAILLGLAVLAQLGLIVASFR